MNATPHVPVSVGELIDKITILEIKVERLPSQQSRELADLERRALEQVLGGLALPDVADLRQSLRSINEQLWEVEDALRDCERAGQFDEEFIRLARSVYRMNDERARLKAAINEVTGSEIREQKGYAEY